MKLDDAILKLKSAVKHTGTIDQKHIDLTLVSAQDRPLYEEALKVVTLAIKGGTLSRDELFRKLNLDH